MELETHGVVYNWGSLHSGKPKSGRAQNREQMHPGERLCGGNYIGWSAGFLQGSFNPGNL